LGDLRYHTVFLEKATPFSLSKELLRLEKAMNHLDDPARPLTEKKPNIIIDYQILDYSIACSTLDELLKYSSGIF
jgi:hypothetical protein